jgi:hypothetical protein
LIKDEKEAKNSDIKAKLSIPIIAEPFEKNS